MKNNMSKYFRLAAVIFLICILGGCSNKSKTEEELRAEIRAELEAEQSRKNEKSTETETVKETEKEAVLEEIIEVDTTRRIKIMTSVLNVRSGNNTDSDIIGTVHIDENYEVLGEDDRWYKVQFEEDKEGWIAGWYCMELVNGSEDASQAPEFPIPDGGQIEISLDMGKDDLIKAIGEGYTIETIDDGGYFRYATWLKYDDISFLFYHDETLTNDMGYNSVYIISNKYTLKNIDFKLGDPLVDVFAYCEENFKPAYDFHSEAEIPMMWQYTEGHDGMLWINFNVNKYDRNSQLIEDNSKLLYLKEIELWMPLD